MEKYFLHAVILKTAPETIDSTIVSRAFTNTFHAIIARQKGYPIDRGQSYGQKGYSVDERAIPWTKETSPLYTHYIRCIRNIMTQTKIGRPMEAIRLALNKVKDAVGSKIARISVAR